MSKAVPYRSVEPGSPLNSRVTGLVWAKLNTALASSAAVTSTDTDRRRIPSSLCTLCQGPNTGPAMQSRPHSPTLPCGRGLLLPPTKQNRPAAASRAVLPRFHPHRAVGEVSIARTDVRSVTVLKSLCGIRTLPAPQCRPSGPPQTRNRPASRRAVTCFTLIQLLLVGIGYAQ